MQQQALDYRSPEVSRQSKRVHAAVIAMLIVIAAVGAANSFLIEYVINGEPGGWEDLAVVLWFGPLVNGLLFPLALSFCSIVRRRSGRMWAILFIIVSAGAPLLGYYIDYVLITGHHLR